MNWQFIDRNTLRESSSGYEIHLGGGTWFHPLRLRPQAPKGMNFSLQLKLLKSGLQHVKSIGSNRNIQIDEKLENKKDDSLMVS